MTFLISQKKNIYCDPSMRRSNGGSQNMFLMEKYCELSLNYPEHLSGALYCIYIRQFCCHLYVSKCCSYLYQPGCRQFQSADTEGGGLFLQIH